VRFGARARLFLLTLGLIAATVVAAEIYLRTALDALLTERIREDLFRRAALVQHIAYERTLAGDDVTGWDAFADAASRPAAARITVIRRDGVVLGDSDVDRARIGSLDNHGGRPEVMDALAHGQGANIRQSATLRRRMMYVATPFRTTRGVRGVVRLSMPLTVVEEDIARARRILLLAMLLLLVLAVAISTIAANWGSKRLRTLTNAARRMAAGDLNARVRLLGSDEFAELGHVLDQLAHNLSATLSDLRSERDLLDSVLRGMQEGVLLLDAEGHIVLVNPALRNMLFLPPDVRGRSLLEVIRHAELKEFLDAARSGGGPHSCEIELAGLKPRRLLVHATRVTPEPQSTNDRTALLAVCVDVTDLRRLESLRRDFVANVSHELRTPVAALRSAAETLQTGAADDPNSARRFLGMIERNAERLHRLIEDLLDLSRIESSEFRLHVENVDLASVVRHVLAIFEDDARAKSIRLRAAVDSPVPPARADRRALEQILSNLIDNAIKYSSFGASVTVRAVQTDRGLTLVVEDTGPGIGAKHLPRLFERFYRVDPGRSRALGGTGLGLAIVKHLTEAMGGQVSVTSVAGRGATFSVTLPRAGELSDST
jgi:two-component system phosphate regulon sensor histidine kinase PhoR